MRRSRHPRFGWLLAFGANACRAGGDTAAAPGENHDAGVEASAGGSLAGSGGAPFLVDTSDLVAPVQLPWVPHTDDPTCQHVEVVKDCQRGWCRIPAGCFVMGSPEDEPGRAMEGETLTTVHLTHSFEIGQFEVTRGQWAETGWELPQGAPEVEVAAGNAACDEPACPMTRMSWFAAMHFANWLSEQAVPPLQPCYTLEGCQGVSWNPASCFSENGCTTGYIEYLMDCQTVDVNTPAGSVYDCEGYRLPTDAEWEYAARAGARTSYFTGPMSQTVASDPVLATHEPTLDDYAWYYYNSPGSVPPVGHKGANAWGVHDIHGNVWESVSNPRYVTTEEAPATDPWAMVDASLGQATIRGGSHVAPPALLRLAQRLTSTVIGRVSGGFRLVRTLPSE